MDQFTGHGNQFIGTCFQFAAQIQPLGRAAQTVDTLEHSAKQDDARAQFIAGLFLIMARAHVAEPSLLAGNRRRFQFLMSGGQQFLQLFLNHGQGLAQPLAVDPGQVRQSLLDQTLAQAPHLHDPLAVLDQIVGGVG